MPLIYRAMLRDGDKPRIGPTKKMLGVKAGGDLHDDIAPDANGDVHPGNGGMSVSPAWRDLPAHRIPRRLRHLCPKARGTNDYVCWRMGAGSFEDADVASGLRLVVDTPTHGTIQPADVMSVEVIRRLWAPPKTSGSSMKTKPMIERALPITDAFSTYVELLIRLHHLMTEDKGDSDEAEEVRDRMDLPWRRLNPDQIALVDGLSEDLYTIGEDRNFSASEPDKQLEKQFVDAVDRGDWRTALDAIRSCEMQLPPTEVARLRGTCWLQLAQFNAAIEFFLEQERLQPLEPTESALLLFSLIRANRLAEAKSRIAAPQMSEAPPPLLLAVGIAWSLRSTEVEYDAATEMRWRSVELLEKGLRAAAECSWENVSKQERTHAYLHLAANYQALGDEEKATRACTEALNLDPNNLDALLLHGWLIHKSEPETGQKEFHRGFLNRLPSGLLDSLSASSFAAHQ